MTINIKEEVAFLVPSFDAMRDIWPLYVTSIKENWTDRPKVMCLGTEKADFEDDAFCTIKTGSNLKYSDIVLSLAQAVKNDWIILGVDDFPLKSHVNTNSLRLAVNLAAANKADFVNLLNMPFEIASIFEEVDTGSELVPIQHGSPYSIALGMGLWRRESLLKLIKPSMTAWEIERAGSDRIESFKPRLYRLGMVLKDQPPFQCVNLIQSKKWTREGIEYCTNNNHIVDINSRSLEPKVREVVVSAYQTLRFLFFSVAKSVIGLKGLKYFNKIVKSERVKFRN